MTFKDKLQYFFIGLPIVYIPAWFLVYNLTILLGNGTMIGLYLLFVLYILYEVYKENKTNNDLIYLVGTNLLYGIIVPSALIFFTSNNI